MDRSDEVTVEPRGGGVRLRIRFEGRAAVIAMPDLSPRSFLTLHGTLADLFGAGRVSPQRPPAARGAPYEVLLDRPAAPDILYGYGDPCVLRTQGPDHKPVYHLFVTSNDAPDSFPILRSDDLVHWTPCGAMFPRGRKPPWALDGPGAGDFWAPEVHPIGGEFWACFSARDREGTLAIGLAKARSPEGPYAPDPHPLLAGGVIDPHLHVDPELGPILYWKEDHNDLWPGLLAAWLQASPQVSDRLFATPANRRSARLAGLLWPWIETLDPMTRFCALGGLISAATEEFDVFRRVVAGQAPEGLTDALRTRILAQRLDLSARRLADAPVCVLENDAPWEAHLIEGVWLWRAGERYHLFYAGNDFASSRYGLGVAVGEHPLGPFRKLQAPLLISDQAWQGPGHASVALGPEGRPLLFFHAFRPGAIGYKAFRALLAVGIEPAEGGVRLHAPDLSRRG